MRPRVGFPAILGAAFARFTGVRAAALTTVVLAFSRRVFSPSRIRICAALATADC